MGKELAKKDFFIKSKCCFFTTRSREEACAAVEGFPARPERAARRRGTERERALEAQFSDGIRDAAFACRVVES